ncbi:MAG TPA: hypothetical protein VI485_03370 [Vicinamibacterales bacterium]|nr:hypothetical protein [Vicinamibacterales bacterium]
MSTTRRWGGALAPIAGAVLMVAIAVPADAANECQVSYVYTSGSGPSAVPKVVQAQVSANAIKTVNQGAMRYVVNDKDWPVEVEVTTLPAGTKWVQLLEKGDRDPANGNYVGNIELEKVKCLPGGKAGSGGGAGGAAGQSLQSIVNQAFAAVKTTTVPYANQLNAWTTDALATTKKVADMFTGCPSPAAQLEYDGLTKKRENAVQARNIALQAANQASLALGNCMKLTNNSPACSAAHTPLPFAAQYAAADAAIKAIDGATSALRNMKCVRGCGQSAKITVPNASVKPGGTVSQQIVANNVCTEWDRGGFGVSPSAVLSGNTAQMANIETPHCSRRENIPLCTRWNISVLLPKLKELRLVPADVQVANVDLQIPMRTIQVVNGVSPARCATPLRICKPAGMVQVNQGQNAFSVTAGASCTEQVTLGCANPAFGLEPSYARLQVPDLQRATIRLVGGRFTPSQITVDLTRPEFQAACGGTDITLPLPPTVQLSFQTVDLPFMCTQPTLVNLVANP